MSVKAVHYDHGNGIAVADVDGDGREDIYFISQVGTNELYRNLGGGKFENITEKAAVALVEQIGVTASFADTDNDGDPDLYVTTVCSGNFFFENEGAGKFKDITKSCGLEYTGHSSAGVFFDYDRDGLLDLFLANVGKYTTEEKGPAYGNYLTNRPPGDATYYVGYPDAFSGHLKPERAEQSILYKNLGENRFVDVTEKMGLVDTSWTGDASPLDANQDGWPDLYILNMQGHDEYYENDQGKRFVKKSRKLFPRTSWGSMGIKVFDYDNDGQLDIYITDMHTDMVEILRPHEEKIKIRRHYDMSYLHTDGNHVMGNAFFRNQGSGVYHEISAENGAENFWPWGLSVGDFNADGYDDVFIASSMNFNFRYAVNSVLLNNRGKHFLDSEFILGVEPRRGGRTAKVWFELDCDGADRDTRTAPDLGLPDSFCKDLNGKTRKGRVTYWDALGSRSSVIFDLDGDGDLDIVTNDFNSEPMVLISNLTEKKKIHFIKVKLVGIKSNRSGLGAKVIVRAGTEVYTKVQDGKSGYLSQSLFPLYFGLGEVDQVDQIEVSWPSGSKQVIKGPVQTNRLIEIKEE